MLAKKIIRVYGKEDAIAPIANDGGIGISVKFLTVDEVAFLRVMLNRIIDENTHSHLITAKQKLELLNKLEKSVLYETYQAY